MKRYYAIKQITNKVSAFFKNPPERLSKDFAMIYIHTQKVLTAAGIITGSYAFLGPGLGTGTLLGFAAYIGYHFERARESVKDLINYFFFE